VFDGCSVNAQAPAKRVRVLGKVAAALLCLALWLGLIAVGSSPQLHHLLHSDASGPSHDCVFTQVSKGQFLAAGGILILAVANLLSLCLSFELEQFPPQAADVRLASSRAPPACSLLAQ